MKASSNLMLAFLNPVAVRNKKSGRKRSIAAEDRVERRHGGAAGGIAFPSYSIPALLPVF
jgi:hypothetical protein